MAKQSIRLLVVDDHAIVRKGIKALLSSLEDIEVVGEAGDGQDAVDKTNKLIPDVVLMDLVMPRFDGISAISQISSEHPNIKIIALTSFATDDKVFPAIKAGAIGYILKDSDPDDLIKAIYQVYQNEPALQPSIARKVLNELNRPARKPPTPEPLTERELEVLKLVSQGYSNQEIADILVIEEVTVRTHVSHILRKLQLANRVQATLYALKEGITSIESFNDTDTK
ncbi:MAG: response regulator [Anaerolineales bacterium]|jgi:NarL family two-component system response regulator LiaR